MAKRARIFKPNGKSVKANEVYRKVPFFCDVDGCNAPMVIVSMGEDSAHFRSKSKGAHRFPECIRNDIIFNTDRYSKKLFKLKSFKERVLSSGSEKINIHNGSGGGGNVGTGSKIAPDTLKSIYAAYIESLSSGDDTIGDCKFQDFMRCKENYTDFENNPCGFFVVEASFYYQVKEKGKTAFVFNVPGFYQRKGEILHVRVNFADEKDFERVKERFYNLKKPYLCTMLIAAEWKRVEDDSDCIAECTVKKSSQHTYLT